MVYISETFLKMIFYIVLMKFMRSLDSIHFSVEELKAIQQSNDPFTNEELNILLDEELNRPVDEMDTDVVDFLIDEIE